MTFDKVLPKLKKGQHIARECWGDRLKLFVLEQYPVKDQKFIYGKGHRDKNSHCSVFYKFSQEDILAQDWYVL